MAAVSHVNAPVTIEQDDDSTFTVNVGGGLSFRPIRAIRTTVTSSGAVVEAWLHTTYRIPGRLIIGLDVEWLHNTSRYCNNPVALIQLCIDNRCLIFQIIHADYIPTTLHRFLTNNRFKFVGVGIDGDVQKLFNDYNLRVTNSVDLRDLAIEKLGRRDLRMAGLKVLAREVMRLDVEKMPMMITLSRWDDYVLTLDQVQYACVDAFLSHGIGQRLFERQDY